MRAARFVELAIKKLKESSNFKSIEISRLCGAVHGVPATVSVNLKTSQETILSFGQGPTADEAAFKALMELLERYVLVSGTDFTIRRFSPFSRAWNTHEIYDLYPDATNWHPNNSNGMAVHFNRKRCIQNSINEAIERHVILKAMACDVRPFPVHRSNSLNIFGMFDVRGLSYHVWRGPLNRFVVVARYKSHVGHCYGFGCSITLEEAIAKAFFELSPRIETVRRSEILDLPTASDSPNYEFHFLQFRPQTDAFFSKKLPSAIPIVDGQFKPKDIWIKDFILPTELSSLRIVCTQVFSPLWQPLFSGDWCETKINPAAISKSVSLPVEYHVVG